MAQSGFEANFVAQQLSSSTRPTLESFEIVPNILFLPGFGNTGAILTSTGVVIVDTGNPLDPTAVLGRLRQRTSLPIKYIILTHGHADHAANTRPLLQEAAQRNDPPPIVLAHAHISQRMDRYAEMWAHNDLINRLQFQLPPSHSGFPKNEQFVRPDVTYQDQFSLTQDDVEIYLHHYEGETNCGTWVHIPHNDVVFSGDLFISSCPNIGNPFKLPRFDLEWAQGLEQIAACQPKLLLPGHGSPVQGAERIQDALLTTALSLRYLHDDVVMRLNQGQYEAQIVQEVQLPAKLANHWAMAPVYGDPRFIVRAIARRYAGWYDGNSSHLFPAPSSAIAKEMMGLIDETALLQRADQLLETQEEQLALALLDLVLETKTSHKAATMKQKALTALAQRETSLIARSILNGVAHVGGESAYEKE